MSGLSLADFGEVEVDHGGLERAVAEVGGNLADTDSGL